MSPQQCADAVLMVRPRAFGYNPETAATNTFQRPQDLASAAAAIAQARAEFERLAQALGSEGISVCAVDDSPDPAKPDAVFPNNWLSFHDDGTLVLYPMQSASRRLERRQEVIDAAVKRLNFKVSQLIDLTRHESEGRFLEGTGDEALGDSRVLVMSETARRALKPELFAQLSGCTDTVLAVPVPTIEKLGGGSVRCMLAEVFRPA